MGFEIWHVQTVVMHKRKEYEHHSDEDDGEHQYLVDQRTLMVEMHEHQGNHGGLEGGHSHADEHVVGVAAEIDE